MWFALQRIGFGKTRQLRAQLCEQSGGAALLADLKNAPGRRGKGYPQTGKG